MKKTFDRTQSGPRCMLCAKGPVMEFNRPHSLQHTKRLVKPNIQSFYGMPVCTRCLRTLKTEKAAAEAADADKVAEKPAVAEAAATVAAE